MEGQICLGVCDEGLRPTFSANCPLPYLLLTKACWHADAAHRHALLECAVAAHSSRSVAGGLEFSVARVWALTPGHNFPDDQNLLCLLDQGLLAC